MKRGLLTVAALLGALAVALGAFGAHALEGRLDERALEVWQTANRYHFYHVLGLLGLGLWQRGGGDKAGLAAGAWLLGLTLFSGGLYVYALTGLKLGAVLAPLGGLSFLVGWLALSRLEMPRR
jgi:uncharacterized membrane protein YgdD (TMEM256/DUF423 family)